MERTAFLHQIRCLDVAFPGVVFRVRPDGGFAAPEVLEFLDRQPRVEYVVNLASNAVLDRLVEPAMRTARRLSKKSGQTEHVYGCVWLARTALGHKSQRYASAS